MAEKRTVKVSRQVIELARLHVEAARKAGRKPDEGVARIANAHPDNGSDSATPAPA
ncbi:hypothetical protein [Kribbella sp. NPDC004536]|uniref:hypothetical protein n=1 Tax=Kribbella sp. NPDC004536 TaxID=3364106 RepID=UPI00367B8EFE